MSLNSGLFLLWPRFYQRVSRTYFPADDIEVEDRNGQSADLDSFTDAIRILRESPDDLLLSADYKDVVYTALLEFEHEWRRDRWWTPAGEFRTLGELRRLHDRIQTGDRPDVSEKE